MTRTVIGAGDTRVLYNASRPMAEPAIPAASQAYSRQLSHGFRRLRFDAPLEAQYAEAVRQEQFRPAVICGIAALLVWAGFAASDFIRLDIVDHGIDGSDVWVLLGARWSVLLVLLTFIATPLRRMVPIDRAAFIIYCAIGLAVAITAVIYRSRGIPAADTAQIVVVMAAFLPLGMSFYQATAAALLLVIATTVAGLVWLDTDEVNGHLATTLVMALALPVGAVGSYLREYSHRHQFLLTAILKRQAQYDPLTDLANRRLFERHAQTAMAQAARSGNDMVLAIIDIDHFKAFNDQFGHAAGDVALRTVAEVIGQTARRPMDMAARLGGEEFALLLYDCDMDRAGPILDALRQRISATALVSPRGGFATVSLGATQGQAGETLETVYERADQLLYAAKTAGRNRLTTG